ncbi:hypothetical protein J5N97_027339 [Dioscorea zingiberensis]|uniref:Uncharacterized protein n=1 Tax=Dioscorea zingiberensis TaxID=325984 RepID=A0A9D5C484_9LILI|nr:hypothetical protein J5N97_027339 [Dioscorea zingiberensis]
MSAGEAAKEYAAGFVAGVATVIVGHPFDTVKVKLQAYNTNTQVKEYKNAWQCTSQILRTEGVRGLYRGASSSFIGMAFESSLLFGLYSQTKKFLQGEAPSSHPQLQVIIPSAAYGGAIISLILCPAELVKCRMQVQGKESSGSMYARYSGPSDCALKTLKSEGLKGIFRGGYTTLLRESIGNATFFTTYEFTVLPLDVAKTVIQTAPDTSSSRNPFQTLRSIYRRVGFRGFYTGLGPTLVRAFPANATAMVTWELTAKLLGVQRP